MKTVSVIPYLFVLACLTVLLPAPVRLSAATNTVTSLADSGPGSLRAALGAAAAGDTIDFSISGTITLTSGELVISKSVTLLGPGADALKVSGNNASRVFWITATDVNISGLTVADGFATGASGHEGGGIWSCSPDLVLNNCVISNNYASLRGGGIYSAYETLTVSNCIISGNSAGLDGGGIYGGLTVIASTVSTNWAYDTGGGMANGGTTAVIACTFSGNSALYGGGISNVGGDEEVTLAINSSTFIGNEAENGGGIWNYSEWADATLTISASTFSANRAGNVGGGVMNQGGNGARLTINASTFGANHGDPAGAILNEGSLEIGSTILDDTSGWGGTIDNDVGTVTSAGYNLSSDDGGGCLTNATDIMNADPKLGPLQDNGGPTWTHALLPGSPAIDRGRRDAIPALALTTDQRGLTRPVDSPGFANAAGGDGSDIGAFELQGSEFDSDADRLPDFWELAYFGDLNQTASGDFDRDGQNNLFEYLAGSNPTNPASVFMPRAETVPGHPNQMHLVFTPWAAGRTYTPQFTTNLAVPFAPLTGYSGPITNGTEVIFTDVSATQSQKFYRLQISLSQ
jgi:hypothetical protein